MIQGFRTTLDLMLIRAVRGMRSCWPSGDGQLTGDVVMTVAVRWIPCLSAWCGTWVARTASWAQSAVGPRIRMKGGICQIHELQLVDALLLLLRRG
jgi:hypothetical protein